MDNAMSLRLDAIVEGRMKASHDEILSSIGHIAEGNPLASEPNKQRRVMRLQAKASLTKPEAEMISMGIDAATAQPMTERIKSLGPEAIIGSTLDFVNVAFLERGRRAADAVGRVAFYNGGPQGSGFVVAPGLFLTNHHVLTSESAAAGFCVEFDYEIDLNDRPRSISRFAFDPERCFVTDGIEGLDFTLIAIGAKMAGPRKLDEFGYIPLSDAKDKHMLGEVANLVQHPLGRYKEVVLRENRLVARNETAQVLHYIADTEQGSSGSPVFNNEWEAIALHHWAGPYREIVSTGGAPLDREINEGIRISAIVKTLRQRLPALVGQVSQSVSQALTLWTSMARPTPTNGSPHRETTAETTAGGPRQNKDGSVTWTFPIEINVRAPLLSPHAPIETPQPMPIAAAREERPRPEAASWTTEDFSDRGGYEPGFIPGFLVPLPKLAKVKYRPARNQEAEEGDDPHELRYHHFSIVMNAERRLAFFTACNIDGSRIKAVVREDKSIISNPTLKDLGIESIGAEGAEATDAFRRDRRILPEEQMAREFYEKQIVAGFPEPQSKERIARIFQKGHITLRGDPAWGSETEAAAAERDTFFYTNAAPQIGFFNQGSQLNRPGSKGKLRWRAVETYVLRNAVTTRSRICVFAGPIFNEEDDKPYRFDSKVPLQFWKIAVWAEDNELRAIALIADQGALIQITPESMGEGSEAFTDNLELARVSEFLTTVEEIETLTGLDFGEETREADVRAGAKAVRIPAQDIQSKDLKRRRSTPRPRKTQKRKTA